MLDEGLYTRRPKLDWYSQGAIFLLILVELGWVVPWYEIMGGESGSLSRWDVMLVLGAVMIAA